MDILTTISFGFLALIAVIVIVRFLPLIAIIILAALGLQ